MVGTLSACFFIAIELNYRVVMLLWFTLSQISIGAGIWVSIKLYTNTHRKFFWFFSFKKRTRKPFPKLTHPSITSKASIRQKPTSRA